MQAFALPVFLKSLPHFAMCEFAKYTKPGFAFKQDENKHVSSTDLEQPM